MVNVVALENQLGSTTYLIWLEFPPTVRGITFFIKCKIFCKCPQGLTANLKNWPNSFLTIRARDICLLTLEQSSVEWLNPLSLRDTGQHRSFVYSSTFYTHLEVLMIWLYSREIVLQEEEDSKWICLKPKALAMQGNPNPESWNFFRFLNLEYLELWWRNSGS